ncbi:hypothetical protein GIB67_034856 [Kingdonia uniflora]|uniref:Subtilisin-like protease SBT5.6 n=1 Tax=Kingdonia uniflora TaxID=39325 RepID=A0A7J7MEF3_9MAGN|nr:hypothetical protein GIB67_034856 [Kingdonia uniflora]
MNFFLLSSLLKFLPLLVLCDDLQVYIVYLREHGGYNTHQEIEDTHHSYLLSVKSTEEEARASLLYSYKNSINGFSALLSVDEAALLSKRDEVVSAFPSIPNKFSLQTTRSWKFLGLEGGLGDRRRHGKRRGGLLHEAKYGKDVTVGLLDSGIWPESRSFHDNGLGPVPKKWKGICQAGDYFNASHCNRKLIGARYYLKAYEASNGPLNVSNDYRSSRDKDGHGTHTASTVGGRSVKNVAALGGFAHGTATGGAPLVRLAMYKVCWPLGGKTLEDGDTCLEADMLAAIDDAIGDGVDILSISIGSDGPIGFSEDGISVGALHAIKRNIVVSCAAGNSGPTPATVSNTAPWIITVGASSIDRVFSSPVDLGNGMKIKVIRSFQITTYFILFHHSRCFFLLGVTISSSLNIQCLPGSLWPKKMKGKIVLCFRGQGTRIGKGAEVKRAGGAAMILGNSTPNGNEIVVDAHVLPVTGVVADEALKILSYIKSTKKPTAKLNAAETVLDDSNPAPFMAGFSSTGPSLLQPNILKPDITAPGLNILAAWSETSSPTKLVSDHRRVKYNFDSGTSMACPHVAAVAALVKAVHLTWSSAAIRSAIMTTATTKNSLGKEITAASGNIANSFNYGAGHVRPTKTSDPGLVYDASYTDYLLLLCDNGVGNADPKFKCPHFKVPRSTSNLNYPSLAISSLKGSTTVKRTVTNVGGSGKTVYFSKIDQPEGFNFKINPRILYFSHVGEKKSFTIKVQKGTGKNTIGEYFFGWYLWTDGIHVVRSPIAVSAA